MMKHVYTIEEFINEAKVKPEIETLAEIESRIEVSRKKLKEYAESIGYKFMGKMDYLQLSGSSSFYDKNPTFYFTSIGRLDGITFTTLFGPVSYKLKYNGNKRTLLWYGAYTEQVCKAELIKKLLKTSLIAADFFSQVEKELKEYNDFSFNYSIMDEHGYNICVMNVTAPTSRNFARISYKIENGDIEISATEDIPDKEYSNINSIDITDSVDLIVLFVIKSYYIDNKRTLDKKVKEILEINKNKTVKEKIEAIRIGLRGHIKMKKFGF